MLEVEGFTVVVRVGQCFAMGAVANFLRRTLEPKSPDGDLFFVLLLFVQRSQSSRTMETGLFGRISRCAVNEP